MTNPSVRERQPGGEVLDRIGRQQSASNQKLTQDQVHDWLDLRFGPTD